MRLTDEQRLVRDTAREFARRELAPHAAEWDREARFPQGALAELGRLGFMGMLLPTALAADMRADESLITGRDDGVRSLGTPTRQEPYKVIRDSPVQAPVYTSR
jgi:alkylation response protein AidB-like acyl-CoA dehydrogenase